MVLPTVFVLTIARRSARKSSRLRKTQSPALGRDGRARGQDDERGLAREAGHLAEAGEGDPDLAAVDRLDGGREDLDDRRVEGVEGAAGVAPLQGEGVALLEPGRLGHARADEDGDLVALGRGGQEGRRDVEDGLAGVDALDEDRDRGGLRGRSCPGRRERARPCRRRRERRAGRAPGRERR